MATSSPNILNECEALLEKGFSIIPVGPDKKSILEWKDYQAFAPDMDDVRRWYERFNRMGVGIVTGSVSGIIVVDIDVKGKKPTTQDLIDAGLPITKESISGTTVAKTGGGGSHIYFAYSDSDIRNSAGIVSGDGWSVDIRGEGGYVVAPPSLHESGNRYRWLRNETINQLPIELAEFLKSESQKPQREKFVMPDIIPPGQKHDYLVRLAGKLMQSSKFTVDELFLVLKSTLDMRQSPDDKDRVPDSNIKSIASDVVARIESGAWQGAKAEEKPLAYNVLSGEDLWNDLQEPMTDGVGIGMPGLDDIGGLKPGFYTIAARPGAGKSTYLAQCTNAILEADMSVMIISTELTRQMWFGWMVSSVEGVPYNTMEWPPPERWKSVFTSPKLMMLDKMGRINANVIHGLIREHKPNVFILDHLSKLFIPNSKEQRARELEIAIEETQEIAVNAGTTVLAAAHMNRNSEYRGGGKPQLSDLRESGGIENSSDVVAFMYPFKKADMSSNEVPINFLCEKNRLMGHLGNTKLTFYRDIRRFGMYVDPSRP